MIEYEQPSVFPQDGRFNHPDYLNEGIDFNNYVVESGDVASDGSKGARIYGSIGFVTLKGPLKVVVSTETVGGMHATEIVTIPLNETVKFTNHQQGLLGIDLNVGIAPVLKPVPLSPKIRLTLIKAGYLAKQFAWLRYDASKVP